MLRALLSIAAAFIVAVGLAACAEEEEAETASPTVTPAETATPAATEAATATATPLPPTPTPTPELPTPQIRLPTWTISEVSSAGQLQIVIEDGLNAYTIVSVDPELLQYERWEIAFVGDVNADGVDDAIVYHFTGGAHCCFEYLIFSQGSSSILLVDAFITGNASIGAVEDLDGDGIPELDTADDRLAYFPDLSYADSPFLPLVLCRAPQRVYYDCTPQFPEVLGDSARQFEAALRDAVERQAEEYEKRSAALGLLAAYLRLGQDEEGWSRVGSLCPECEAWLQENLGELEKRLSWVQPFRGWPGP